MTTPPRETAASEGHWNRRDEHPWVFAFAASVWCVALGLAVQLFAWNERGFRRSLLHVGSVAAIALLASRPLVDRLARSQLGQRGPVVAWRAFGAGALALGLYHAYTMNYALGSSWSFFSYFSRFWELEPEVFVVPVAVFLAAALLARRTVVSGRRLRIEAVVGALAAATLLSAAVHRARRSPQIQGFVTSLEQLGELHAEPSPSRWDSSRTEESSDRYSDRTFGGVTVRRFVFPYRGQCAALVSFDGASLPTLRSPRGEALGDCDARDVRIDRRRGLVILARETMWGTTSVSGYTRHSVEPLRGDRASMAGWSDAFTLPRAWLWTSALLLFIALGWLAHAASTRRSLRALPPWRQATLRSDGIIEPDGAQLPVPYGAMLAPGPVVLLRPPTGPDGAPFRGGAPRIERDEVVGGTLSHLLGTLESEVEASLACSVTASLLSAAPLVAGAIAGLLP